MRGVYLCLCPLHRYPIRLMHSQYDPGEFTLLSSFSKQALNQNPFSNISTFNPAVIAEYSKTSHRFLSDSERSLSPIRIHSPASVSYSCRYRELPDHFFLCGSLIQPR